MGQSRVEDGWGIGMAGGIGCEVVECGMKWWGVLWRGSGVPEQSWV